MVILGSLIYKASYQIVLELGLPTEWNNFIKAVIFLIALVIGGDQLHKLVRGLLKRPRKEGENVRAE